MDLKQNKITVGELLDHPGARALLMKRFPIVFKKPVSGAGRTVTLEQLLAIVGPWLPQRVVQDTLQELKKL